MKSTAPLPSEKQCGGTCKRVLPLSEFGTNRSRTDGRHLYCKVCTCAIVAKSRQGLKDYKAAKQQRQRERQRHDQAAAMSGATVKTKATVEDRIIAAIREGINTQTAIRKHIKIRRSSLDQTLAEMLIDTRALVIAGDHGENDRVYALRS